MKSPLAAWIHYSPLAWRVWSFVEAEATGSIHWIVRSHHDASTKDCGKAIAPINHGSQAYNLEFSLKVGSAGGSLEYTYDSFVDLYRLLTLIAVL
jgi:hypothetical protein